MYNISINITIVDNIRAVCLLLKGDRDMKKDSIVMPLIALRGLVAFPYTKFSFDVSRYKSIEAIENSMLDNQKVFLTTQINNEDEDIDIDRLYNVGVMVQIKQIIKLPANVLRVVVQGEDKAKINNIISTKPFITAEVEILSEEEVSDKVRETAIFDMLNEGFEKYTSLSGRIAPDFIMDVISAENLYELVNLLCIRLPFSIEKKQEILSEDNIERKTMLLLAVLNSEIEILTIQNEINLKVKSKIDKSQKEYYLREQIKTIQEELGDKSEIDAEIDEYRKKLKKISPPDYVVERIEKELARLKRSSVSSAENSVSRDYIDLILALPWSKKSKENSDIKKARDILNKDHYGLYDVKERILEFLAVRQNTNNSEAPVLCLAGPPGSGKTSVAKSIAHALNRKYMRIALGGIHDEAEIRGHRKTYIGAMPGRIINCIKLAGASNPLILLDEIDKLSNDYKGDPSAALLEVLDIEQNFSFRDNYVEMPFDISDVFFICTANDISKVSPALKDRLEIIELSSYTEEEKFNIAKDYLVLRQLKRHGLKKSQLKFKEDALRLIINCYTREAGVRQLERQIRKICRKTVTQILAEELNSVTISGDKVKDYLGVKKFYQDNITEKNEIGSVCGLAWTSAGGTILCVEANTMKGKGRFSITGNVGKVMDESAKAAVSYIRANSGKLNINDDFYKNTDIHIHIPEGAVPKDGPSAGITLTTAIVSALTSVPVRSDVAMTGEITIRGKVLPIGGLKEKVLAAKRVGVKKIIIPSDNESDLSELPDYAKDGIEFILASEIDEVLNNALVQ